MEKLPRKRRRRRLGYDNALETFHKNVFAAVERHVDFQKIKCLVVDGPGFAKDTFLRYLEREAEGSRPGETDGGEQKARVPATPSCAIQGGREVPQTPR